jgi:hypothetical protein
MKIKYPLLLLILTIAFSSCSQKKEIELEDYKGLIRSMVNITEQSVSMNHDLAKNVNAINNS